MPGSARKPVAGAKVGTWPLIGIFIPVPRVTRRVRAIILRLSETPSGVVGVPEPAPVMRNTAGASGALATAPPQARGLVLVEVRGRASAPPTPSLDPPIEGLEPPAPFIEVDTTVRRRTAAGQALDGPLAPTLSAPLKQAAVLGLPSGAGVSAALEIPPGDARKPPTLRIGARAPPITSGAGFVTTNPAPRIVARGDLLSTSDS